MWIRGMLSVHTILIGWIGRASYRLRLVKILASFLKVGGLDGPNFLKGQLVNGQYSGTVPLQAGRPRCRQINIMCNPSDLKNLPQDKPTIRPNIQTSNSPGTRKASQSPDHAKIKSMSDDDKT